MYNTTQLNDSKKIVIAINSKPLWKVSRGHQPHRGGAGVMGDSRLKRLKTRGAQKRTSINEY
jgi:hypothetical protein|tara:strand:- start:2257 stop:2442 length:186 start_codon:yes stop_codon:yes gene_type:complete